MRQKNSSFPENIQISCVMFYSTKLHEVKKIWIVAACSGFRSKNLSSGILKNATYMKLNWWKYLFLKGNELQKTPWLMVVHNIKIL